MARIICIANQKGGIGKTSCTLWLAGALSVDYNQKVLVIDADAQQTINDLRTMEREQGTEVFPFEVISTSPESIEAVIEEHFDSYDLIFLDMPRMTGNDEMIVDVLAVCDSMLVPFVASTADTMSTGVFMNIVESLGEIRKEENLPFYSFGFLNKSSRRKENDFIPEYAKDLGITIFDTPIKDKKVFQQISTNKSILDSKDGKTDFKPFVEEFIKKFELKISTKKKK
jgi:chromosome partitioning protein